MKLVFGTDHYAYSESIGLGAGKNYLPVIGFVDDSYDIGKNSHDKDNLANVKDSPHITLGKLIDANGDYASLAIKHPVIVEPERTAIRKAFENAIPDGKKRVLVVQKEFKSYSSSYANKEFFFAWLPLDKELSRLGNGADYTLTYYSSPFTYRPSTRTMIVCHNVNTAVTHLLTIIPRIECALNIKKIRAQESHLGNSPRSLSELPLNKQVELIMFSAVCACTPVDDDARFMRDEDIYDDALYMAEMEYPDMEFPQSVSDYVARFGYDPMSKTPQELVELGDDTGVYDRFLDLVADYRDLADGYDDEEDD